tara:strand:+ start:521 stop:1186 length:666 start_codon:yes stop_codon:yes gene_type:complete
MNLKIKLISSLFLMGTLSLSAQNSEPKVGIKAGLGLSNLISNNINDQNMRVGFTGGLFFKSPVSSRLSIQPEILISGKGTTAFYEGYFSGEGEFTHKFDYLELPVLAVFNFTENINIHLGPYFAYMLDASVQNVSENSDYNYVEQMNANDFQRLDYGFASGLGFEFEAIGFGMRYSYGMNEVGKEQGQGNSGLFPDQSEESSEAFKDLRNSSFSFFLSFGF